MTLQDLLNSQVDVRALGALVRRGWRWWIDELADLLPAAWRPGLSSRPRVFAERGPKGAWRFWRDGEPLAGLPSAPGAVGVLIPADAVLVRRIFTPRMPAADVRRMLALDLDRLSPLNADLVHFDSEVIEQDPDGARQSLMLGIVPRAVAARVVDEARARGLAPAALAVRVAGDERPNRFDFLPAVRRAAGERPRRSARTYWWGAAAALAVLNLAVWVGRDMAGVADLRHRVEAQGPAVSVAARLLRKVDDEDIRRRDMVARGFAAEPLRMLNALTEAAPRGSWVQHLEWNGQAVRIIGFRSPELDMAAAVRGSGYFTNPRSSTTEAAPTTAGGEPFDITADAKVPART